MCILILAAAVLEGLEEEVDGPIVAVDGRAADVHDGEVTGDLGETPRKQDAGQK